jgi:hypothetical protein
VARQPVAVVRRPVVQQAVALLRVVVQRAVLQRPVPPERAAARRAVLQRAGRKQVEAALAPADVQVGRSGVPAAPAVLECAASVAPRRRAPSVKPSPPARSATRAPIVIRYSRIRTRAAVQRSAAARAFHDVLPGSLPLASRPRRSPARRRRPTAIHPRTSSPTPAIATRGVSPLPNVLPEKHERLARFTSVAPRSSLPRSAYRTRLARRDRSADSTWCRSDPPRARSQKRRRRCSPHWVAD